MTVLLLMTAVAALALLVWRRLRHGRTKPVRRGVVLGLVVALLGMQALIGTPAFAAPTDCAPNPERPDSGMVGALDPSNLQGQPGSIYHDFGYAGLTWHFYDPNCGAISSMSSPSAVIDTWVGNELMNVAKVIVGATNGLHYAILGNYLVKPLDDLVTTGTKALYDSVFAPFLGLAALGLGILLFRQIWRGDLASISKRSMWALAGLWLASAAYLTPLVYTQVLDNVLIFGTSQLQAGFLKEIGLGDKDALPTMLHNNVVFRNWERGEFGSPDAPQAGQFGTDLVKAQAFSVEEKSQGKDADPNNTNAKKQAYVDVRGKLGNATGYFDGIDGSRTGDGFLAVFQALVFSLFQLLAKAAILLAQVLLRMVVLTGPLIGLAAIVFPDLLRKIGRAAGAALLNVVIISGLAGLHTMVLTWIFSPANGLSLLIQMLLAGLVTVAFFMIGKPGRRMMQMVQLSVGAMGSEVGRAQPGLWARMRGRRQEGATAQDEFWDNVRDGEQMPRELTDGQRGNRRYRPEAANPVLATAHRLDRSAAELPAGSGYPGSAPALPAGGTPSPTLSAVETARRVDTPSVVDRSWDRRGEDAVIVPSQVVGASTRAVGSDRPAQEPRRAETEMVAGRPVHMIYRPSRGLEIADGDGPSYGWSERG